MVSEFLFQLRGGQSTRQADISARVPEGGKGFFVFATEKAANCISADEFMNHYGQMSQHCCPGHGDRLVRCKRGGTALCKKEGCRRKQAYICIQSLLPQYNPDQIACEYGLCKKCAARNIPGIDDDLEDIEQEEDIDPGDPDLAHYVIYNDILDNEENEADPTLHLDAPETLKTTNRGRFKSRKDYKCSVSGQFLLNGYCKLLDRTSTNTQPPVRFLQLYSMIQSKLPGETYTLDQAEGLLYPTIFWHQNKDGSVTGALPSVIYSDHSRRKNMSNLASVTEHLKARMKDYTLLTATSPTYRAYAFDCVLNHQLHHNSIDVLFKRGLESTIRITNSINPQEERTIDEVIGNPNAKIVAAMQRRGKANTFATMTCDDHNTMGVRAVTEAIHEYADHVDLEIPENREEFKRQLLQNHCNMMTDTWHRTISYFMKSVLKCVNLLYLLNKYVLCCIYSILIPYIISSPYSLRCPKLFGKVEKLYARLEFQSHGARGNKCHVHFLLWLENGNTEKALEENQKRISNVFSHAFSSSYECDAEHLIEFGLIETEEQLKEVEKAYRTRQTHNCTDHCKVSIA